MANSAVACGFEGGDRSGHGLVEDEGDANSCHVALVVFVDFMVNDETPTNNNNINETDIRQ